MIMDFPELKMQAPVWGTPAHPQRPRDHQRLFKAWELHTVQWYCQKLLLLTKAKPMIIKQPVTVIHATADAAPLTVMRNCSVILLQKFS